MTTTKESTDKWFTVYVPPSTGGTESYLRIGSPDTTTETSFLSTLQAAYQASTAQPAVQAAFGTSSTAGMVVYTAGDLVQFVNGTADTRVLNDRYIVHVLNKATIDAASTKKATDADKTYRTYLRLGKPSDLIEGAMQGNAADADLVKFIKDLAYAEPKTVVADGNAKRDLAIGGNADARTYLKTAAEKSDRGAIDRIGEVLNNTNTDPVVRADAQGWARTTLVALQLKLANSRKNEALLDTDDGRTKLAASAANKDPVARRKLIEIYETSAAGLASGAAVAGLVRGMTVAKVQSAQTWAKGVLDGLGKSGDELLARWSLGDGVALYSDRPITLTTPDKLKVSVGSDSRTVFGPSYSEVYDVSNDVIAQIKDGTIATIDQVPDKRLITATLVRRELSGASWRSTKFDQSKSLSYSLSDSGSFGLTSSYAFGAGLKLSNGITAGYDASFGISCGVSTSFKVDCSKTSLETSFPFSKIKYDATATTKANSITLSVNPVENVVNWMTAEKYAVAARVVVGIINAAALAYTAIAAGIGNQKSDASKSETNAVRGFLEAGEAVYITASVVNAALLAGALIVGVIQLVSRKTAQATSDNLPLQPTNIILNSAGIKLQAGTSYINIDPTGIQIYGPQVLVAGPLTNVLPEYLTGNLTATQVLQAEATGGLSLIADDLFG